MKKYSARKETKEISLFVKLLAGMIGLFVLPLLLTGCGGGGNEAVRVDGSSTVYPITAAVAEEFMQEKSDVRVTVGTSGTGGGFSKFLRGETDINDASRPIGSSEVELASQNDINYVELPVAYDGMVVVVNPQNDWVKCLTVEELKRIWEPGSTIDNWSQVRDTFPDRPLKLYGPGTSSGTYDYFTEAIVGEGGASRTDFNASEDDNVLVQGVEGDPGALGFFGMAYYKNNQDRLKLLGVTDSGNPEDCVRPTMETVRTGAYQPLSRPLFVYVRESTADDPSVQAFIEYYLENVSDLAGEVGYVPLSENEYELARQRFRNATTGSMFGGEGAKVGVSLEELLRQNSSGAPADTTAAPADTTMPRS